MKGAVNTHAQDVFRCGRSLLSSNCPLSILECGVRPLDVGKIIEVLQINIGVTTENERVPDRFCRLAAHSRFPCATGNVEVYAAVVRVDYGAPPVCRCCGDLWGWSGMIRERLRQAP